MLKNMKIGKKLISTFVLVTVISSIAGIVGLLQMTNMNKNYAYALTNYGFSQGDVGVFHAEFNALRSTTKDLIIYTNHQDILTTCDQIDISSIKVNESLATIQKTMVNAKEISYYNSIKSEFPKYMESQQKVIELAKVNRNTEAFELFKSEVTPQADKIEADLDALVKLKTTIGNQTSSSLSSEGTSATIIIIAIILIALVLSLFIALKIARSISKPVKEMAEAAQKMAKGDLGVQINVNSKDEIGQLGTAFAESTASTRAYIADLAKNLGEIEHGNLTVASDLDYIGDYMALKKACAGILASLNDTLGQINQASEQVSSGSAQVSDGAQELAQGATEQASSIEELSASITEISTQVKENAAHAADASINVNHVSTEIAISNRHMEEMVSAMSQINESSSQIGKIIKAIEDIAFQTNILALNAAVEAARAGEAGKGFAVVADEVRNLASKSAEAAKDTTSLIENSMKQVENGTRIADETAKSLLKVVESTKVVADNVDQISKASSQQADSIGQVTLGVEQISSVVQTNSATAEQSAAASEELSGQAQVMKALISKFKLTENIQVQNSIEDQSKQNSSFDDDYSDVSKY